MIVSAFTFAIELRHHWPSAGVNQAIRLENPQKSDSKGVPFGRTSGTESTSQQNWTERAGFWLFLELSSPGTNSTKWRQQSGGKGCSHGFTQLSRRWETGKKGIEMSTINSLELTDRSLIEVAACLAHLDLLKMSSASREWQDWVLILCKTAPCGVCSSLP